MSNNKSNIQHQALNEENRTPGTYWYDLLKNAELNVEHRDSDSLILEIFELPEYMSRCPRSGLPDFASIKIMFVPDKLTVNEVSLKLYTNSFMEFRGWHETTVNEYMEDLVNKLKPKMCIVFGSFGIRGNVKTIPSVYYVNPELNEQESDKIITFVMPHFNLQVKKLVYSQDSEF